LRLQGLALRVRWEWLRRTDPSRPWQGLPSLRDDKAQGFFDSLMRIQAGNGQRVFFWQDRWIDGQGADEIAPALTKKVRTRAYNSRTVAQGCADNRWVLDAPSPSGKLGSVLAYGLLSKAWFVMRRHLTVFIGHGRVLDSARRSPPIACSSKGGSDTP
jgi:hypothetical protein